MTHDHVSEESESGEKEANYFVRVLGLICILANLD